MIFACGSVSLGDKSHQNNLSGTCRRDDRALMPWLPMYIDATDAEALLGILNSDSSIAFIVRDGHGRWRARNSVTALHQGRHCLWHHPSGPLPLVQPAALSKDEIPDPWSGWVDATHAEQRETPYFGPGHPGVIWLNVRANNDGTHINISSFEWIGNHYAALGSSASPLTQKWWKQLNKNIKRLGGVLVPRHGPIEGANKGTVWALPSALSRITNGATRDANPRPTGL